MKRSRRTVCMPNMKTMFIVSGRMVYALSEYTALIIFIGTHKRVKLNTAGASKHILIYNTYLSFSCSESVYLVIDLICLNTLTKEANNNRNLKNML